MTTIAPTAPTHGLELVAPPSARPIRNLVRLVWTEFKLVLREPVVLTFVFAFPVITVMVLGGVFDPDDPSFEGVDPSNYYAAGYIGIVIAAIGLIMMPVHLAGYRERGILRRFQVSSFPRWALPVAHLAIGLAMTAVGIAALLTAAWLTYGLPAINDVPRTIFGIVLGSVAFTSIGVAIGSMVGTARSAQGIGMMLFFPLFLLGGGGPPPEAMGDTMKSLSDWLPLTHVIRGIQEPWLDLGSPTNHYLVVAGLLAAATTVWMTLAVRRAP